MHGEAQWGGVPGQGAQTRTTDLFNLAALDIGERLLDSISLRTTLSGLIRQEANGWGLELKASRQ